MTGAAIGALVFAIIWLALRYLMPAVPSMETPVSRLVFGVLCACVATLLCFLTGIEAIAHDRLHSPAINPLLGAESERIKVNLRYLQHTLEQLVLFISGLLGLAYYSADGAAMRAVVATTVVWILSRWVFWIGYHKGPQYRGAGLISLFQSILVLLYVCGRFGYDYGGVVGAAVPIVIYLGIEAFLVSVTRRPARGE